MKKIFKKIIITYVLICMLLPTLFMGMVFAEETDELRLNVERAGNFSANFAINFYDNWSSETYELLSGTHNSRGVVNGDYDFVWPLKEGTYSSSSSFGLRTWSDGSTEYHKGIDFSAGLGTPVYASASGKVVALFNGCTHNYPKDSSCGCGGGYGNHIIIDTDSGILMVYGHLTNVESSINVNDTVTQGQLIGTVGTTGWSTGAHLHFEFVTNDIGEIDDDTKIIDRGELFYGYRYSVDPSLYIGSDAIISVISSGSSKVSTKRGEIKTEYDSQVSPTELVKEELADGEYYKFNNLSFINFVYKNALFKSPLINGEEKDVLTGSGNSTTIDLSTFDDISKLDKLKDEKEVSEYLDITKLMSDGKILPGDILYCDNKDGGEYLLYVGGLKVLYATEDKKAYPNGALKYEYIQHYLQRIRRRLREGHEDDKDFEVPAYGITEVYRINEETATNISEKSANLFFNGKGYFSYAKYYGIPDKGAFNQRKISNNWSFSLLSQIAEFIINLIIYMIRMQVIGWTNLFENLLQHVLVGMSGGGNTAGSETFFGTSATSASGDRVTVEGIFFNKIPLFDANFFNINEEDTSVVTSLRKNLRLWYTIIRNLSLAVLLFGLIYVGIRMALTTIAEKKADYKKMLVTWVFAMCVVLFIHLYMYMVFVVNDITVGFCRDFGNSAAHEEIADMVDTADYNEELSLYDAVRVKAYAFNWKEGVPATIIYVYLVYLLIRISIIYFKRYLTIYILALSGSFMGVKYAFDKISGKKTTSLNKWFKDFTFNVLLQTVHALVYVIYMAMALSVSQTSLVGAFIALILLNFMLKADGIIIKVFGLDKAGTLADVNQAESWTTVMRKFLPIYTISKGVIGLGRGWVGKPLNYLAYYALTDADNVKDAQKELEKKRNQLLGELARKIDKTPIRVLAKHSKYHEYTALMSDELSGELNADLYKAIKEARKLRRKRYTRGIKNFADFSLGAMRKVAAPALMIADPAKGFVMYKASKAVMDKHRTKNRMIARTERYGGTVKQARNSMNLARGKYEAALDTHTNNEYFYQEKMQKLQDDYNNAAPNSDEARTIKEEMDALEKNRAKERSKEMHTLEETYENLYKTEVTYEAAKHERNHKSKIGKLENKVRFGVGAVTGLNAIEEMVGNDSIERYKAYDKSTKQDDKLKDLAKIAEDEKGISQDLKKLKEEYERYGKENDIDEEEIKSMFDKDRGAILRQARKTNVSSATIARAIHEYLYDKNLTKVTDEDVDNVLDKIQELMAERGKKIDFSEYVKESVRNELANKMIADNKGLGFNAKDATKEIRKALGKEGVLKSKARYQTKDDKINQINEEILKKYQEINTYNEIGKVKYKDSLVNINKVHKDLGKKV